MNILILGAGQVGTSVAAALASENNDITVVDTDHQRLRDLAERLDIRTVVGHGSLPSVLSHAGAEEAELLVAVTSSDEVNLLACQIAKLLGAEAYGIAGGAEKCALLVRDYGLAGAYDYRAGGLRDKLAEIPGGIDVYFDNVGGPILEDVLANMALYGRIAVCGLVAEYTAGERRGPANFDQVLMKRLRIEGFFSPDFMDQGEALTARLRQWVDAGQLSLPYDMTTGLENTLAAYVRLFTGGNVGKVLVELPQ